MTREDMLTALGKLQFTLIWPGDWEDIGYTEREIWVNSVGYGYILCDEPTQYWEGPGLEGKWPIIKEKINHETLTYEDIEGTSLVDMLNAIYFEYNDFGDSRQLCQDLSSLAMTDYPEKYFYAMETVEGTEYFDSAEAFNAAYERDWADEAWKDMDDNLLSKWVDRLNIEESPSIDE